MINVNLSDDYWKQLREIVREIIREEIVTAAQKEKLDKFYTIKETCEMLRISESTFHKWRREGKLRVIKNGNVVTVPEEEIRRTILNAKK